MADSVDVETRSRFMSGIKSVNTKPEMQVRQLLHQAGFRYRLHDRCLPGTPDIWLPRWKAVIEVNGCFWHGHMCHLFKWPRSREVIPPFFGALKSRGHAACAKRCFGV